MSRQKELILSGVGGQGTILCGTLIAQAAVLYDGKKATLSSEYGTETRGTFAKSDVIISDEDIYFPDATNPELIVCLHQIAYERYSGKTGEKTLILYDADMVTPKTDSTSNEKGVHIGSLAKDIGNPQTANIITMGLVTGYLNVVTEEGAKKAISSFFSSKGESIISMNQEAFERGLLLGREL